MGEWREYLLDEVIEKFIDYRGKTPTKTDSGVPLITAKVVKNGTIEEPNEFISKDDYHGWMRRGYPEVDDIVLTTEAPLGEVALLKTKDVALAQRIITLRANPKKAYNPFIKYYLQSPLGQFELESRASGTTVLGIKSSVLKKLPVMLPDLPEQRAIATVLSSLDAKIDLLHRQNKTLEAMAEALFRQWFVEEAEEGWEDGTLGDIMEVKGGTTPSTANAAFWDGEYCWTTPKDLSGDQHLYLFDTARKITEDGLKQIGSGLQPAGTLLLSSRAPVGYMAFAAVPMAVNQGYIAINGKEGYSNRFIYLWLKANMEMVKGHANGSTFQEISKAAFKSIELIIPPSERVKAFDEVIEPLFDKVKTNQLQTQSLTKLRDTLLPKLMSGEVRVGIQVLSTR